MPRGLLVWLLGAVCTAGVFASIGSGGGGNHDPSAPPATMEPAFDGVDLATAVELATLQVGSGTYPSSCPGARHLHLTRLQLRIERVSLPDGWSIVNDPATPPTLGVRLGWTPDVPAGDVSHLQHLEFEMLLRNPQGRHAYFRAAPRLFEREICPAPVVQTASPIGSAYPIEWRAVAGSVGKSGCGFLRVQNDRSSGSHRYSVRLLLTHDLGGPVDSRPTISCGSGGRGSWTVNAPSTGFRVDRALSRISTALAGTPTAVQCGVSHGASGRLYAANNNMPDDATSAVLVGGRTSYLYRSVCAALTRHLRGHAVHPLDLASGALTLAHAAAHLRGIESEHSAACSALRSGRKLARLLRIKRNDEIRAFLRALAVVHRREHPRVDC